jgi:prepilin-type N-terminal cleavage/methylation domain-containing protein
MYVKKRPKPGGRDAGAGRLNNRGLTLVEIVVVVAILAIASSIVWMSINTIFGLEAKKTAKELYGAIEKVKVQQMTKAGASYLHLYRLDGPSVSTFMTAARSAAANLRTATRSAPAGSGLPIRWAAIPSRWTRRESYWPSTAATAAS